MTKISIAFCVNYGLYLSNLADALEAEYFDIEQADLDTSMATAVDALREEAQEHRELGLVQHWIEYVISCSAPDLRALGLPGVSSRVDITAHGPAFAFSEDGWQKLFQYLSNQLFGLSEPMTTSERARTMRTVTIIDETLEDFRKRMRDEGRLDPPPSEGR